MNKKTIHIRPKKTNLVESTTLCGVQLHNPNIKRWGTTGRSKRIATDAESHHRHVVYSITTEAADNMEGLNNRTNRYGRTYGDDGQKMPGMRGPTAKGEAKWQWKPPRIIEAAWCAECFGHPKRALAQLAETEL